MKVSDIKKNPGNPRQIKGEKLELLKASVGGFQKMMPLRPIVIDENNVVLGGNMRLAAIKALGLKEIPDEWVRRADDLSEDEKKEFIIKDNAGFGEWDWDVIANEWSDLPLADWGLDVPGFEEVEPAGDADAEPQIDKAAELNKKWGVVSGDLWQIGEHRLLCGDSTKRADVHRLVGNEQAQLLHADPPYGMGKENEGVENDNLYAEKLDKFQMDWWNAFRPYLLSNASAYIWGNAEDLWRLWYAGSLKKTERLTFRNEIVWQKETAQGMMSESHRMYPTASERCLFFMLGEQGFNNNADNYWDGFEPVRAYLDTERQKLNWTNKTVAAFFGFHPRMADHWFSKSQWSMPTEEQYKRLQTEAKNDAFKRDYDELKRDFYKTRAYFNNTHEQMMDVWQYPSVTGDERHEHATPKPIAMIARCLKSSAEKGGLVLEPFNGSGSTMVAAQNTERKCYAMELKSEYVAVCLERMSTAFPDIEIKRIDG